MLLKTFLCWGCNTIGMHYTCGLNVGLEFIVKFVATKGIFVTSAAIVLFLTLRLSLVPFLAKDLGT